MGKIGREARNDARFIARHPRIEAERTDSRVPKAFDGASVLPKLRVRHLREGFPRAKRRLMALPYFPSFVSVV